MRVWIQNPFDSLPIEGYRKQRYWLMAEAFVRAGHDVALWTSDFSHATKRRREVKAGGRERSFRIVTIPTRPYSRNVGLGRILSHRAYAREWERLAVARAAEDGKPDVVIVSLPPIATGTAATRLTRRFGAKLVVDVQDAWPETFYRLLPGPLRPVARLLLLPLRRQVRRLYRVADLVSGVCDRYRALTARADYHRAYQGIELFPPPPCRADPAVPGLRLVYVGNLGRSYDLPTVIAGVRELRRQGLPATLDVAGFGGTVDEDESVRFHGMLEEPELRSLLARCDIGIVPMQTDSFVGMPNKLAEYAAAGLCAVSSLAGETAELIGRYRCGSTYRSGDVHSFVSAVSKTATLDPADARRMCEAEFDAVRIYAAYVAAVEKLV